MGESLETVNNFIPSPPVVENAFVLEGTHSERQNRLLEISTQNPVWQHLVTALWSAYRKRNEGWNVMEPAGKKKTSKKKKDHLKKKKKIKFQMFFNHIALCYFSSLDMVQIIKKKAFLKIEGIKAFTHTPMSSHICNILWLTVQEIVAG